MRRIQRGSRPRVARPRPGVGCMSPALPGQRAWKAASLPVCACDRSGKAEGGQSRVQVVHGLGLSAWDPLLHREVSVDMVLAELPQDLLQRRHARRATVRVVHRPRHPAPSLHHRRDTHPPRLGSLLRSRTPALTGPARRRDREESTCLPCRAAPQPAGLQHGFRRMTWRLDYNRLPSTRERSSSRRLRMWPYRRPTSSSLRPSRSPR